MRLQSQFARPISDVWVRFDLAISISRAVYRA